MIINAKTLRNYVNKISLSGMIPSVCIDFRENGLHSGMFDASTICMAYGELPASSFTEYEALGQIYIRNTKSLAEYLNTFNEDISITKKSEYEIVLESDNRKVTVILGSDKLIEEKHIVSDERIEGLLSKDSEAEFQVDISDLRQLKADTKAADNAAITFDKQEGQLVITVGKEKESDIFTTKIDTEKTDVATVTVGSLIFNILDSADSLIDVKMTTGNPLVVKESHETHGNYVYLIAPIMERD